MPLFVCRVVGGLQAAVLKDMYRNWPWWYELVDLLDMVLAKGRCHTGPH